MESRLQANKFRLGKGYTFIHSPRRPRNGQRPKRKAYLESSLDGSSSPATSGLETTGWLTIAKSRNTTSSRPS